MLAMFVLALCDVTEDAIVDDEAAITRAVRREGCADVSEARRRALRETDVVGGPARGGLSPAAAQALRRRLVAR